MAFVITTASSISCDHPSTGGGAFTLVASQSVLHINGNPVLTGDLTGTTILPNCVQTGSGQNQCGAVTSQTDGPSSVLHVDGVPVLLDDSSGLTDGLPNQTWSVKDAGQAFVQSE